MGPQLWMALLEEAVWTRCSPRIVKKFKPRTGGHAVGTRLGSRSSQLPFQQPQGLLHLLGGASSYGDLGEQEVTLGLITKLKQYMENI